MAYNLQSLITILQQILDPEQTRWIFGRKKPQLQSLLEKAASLQQILEKSSLTKIQSLDSQIRDVALQAEDIIESYMVDRMRLKNKVLGFMLLTPDVKKVTQQLDSLMQQVVKLVEVDGKKMPTGTSSSGASFSSVVVGVDEDLMQLKDRLTGMQSKLEIIPIVGMGGIGKTTLARKLYQDPSIISHFEYAHAWSTVSQDYDMRAILLGLLGCIIEIRMYFPNNNNGSRIVITTRESDVANYADSKSLPHQVQFLSKSESWNLLGQIVFGKEGCPQVLQKIGEKIASDCGGLPLAIQVIGGLLSKMERSKDVWEKIGNDVRAAIVESDEHFSNILSLSYSHLSNHLRPCFLYMGAFPEDYEIKASRIIRMWVAEGFVKSNGNKSLEEEAEDCLNALVERNLVLVREYKNGKPKRYSMHDLLRDLCIRKSNEEKFLYVKNGPKVAFSNPSHVIIHTSHGVEDVCASAESMAHVRSFIGFGRWYNQIPFHVFSALRLVRMLDVMDMEFKKFPTEIFRLVSLRFLGVSCSSKIPSGISRLWKLQTLIAESRGFDVASEIWELSELRHLKLNGLVMFDDSYTKNIVQKKLQTISRVLVADFVIRRGFFESIPNIKKLAIYDGLKTSIAFDLSHLHKLEILRCTSIAVKSGFLPRVRFPCNMKKLILGGFAIHSGVLTTLCALHNLEVLKIRHCQFASGETGEDWEADCWFASGETAGDWEAAEGDEFGSLQFLHLIGLNLVNWRADETNFPRLRHLHLKDCPSLKEIPSGIGEISTLELIELHNCSDSAEASAKQIQEVQQSDYGNYTLQLHIL